MNRLLTVLWAIAAIAAVGQSYSSESAPAAAQPTATIGTKKPAVPPVIKPGDTVVVVQDGAKLVMGEEVRAVLPKGAKITVTGVQGDWIGGYVTIADKRLTGWVENRTVRMAEMNGSEAGQLPDCYDSNEAKGWKALAYRTATELPGFTFIEGYYVRITVQFQPNFPGINILSKKSWEFRNAKKPDQKFFLVVFEPVDGKAGHYFLGFATFADQASDVAVRLKGDTKWVSLARIPVEKSAEKQ